MHEMKRFAPSPLVIAFPLTPHYFGPPPLRYVIDGKKLILLREEGDQKVEACTFEQFEVYSIDVAMSSGDNL